MLVLSKISKGYYQNKVNDILVTVEKNEIGSWNGKIEKEIGLKKDYFCGGFIMMHETLINTGANTKKEVCLWLCAWIEYNM